MKRTYLITVESDLPDREVEKHILHGIDALTNQVLGEPELRAPFAYQIDELTSVTVAHVVRPIATYRTSPVLLPEEI